MDTARLISCVLYNPPIWDKRLKSYSNRDTVDKCWKKVADQLGIKDAALRKKWKYLRDQFAVELGKIKTSHSLDAEGEIYEPKWAHFKSLLFLKDIVKPRQTTSILSSTSRVTVQENQDDYSEAQQDLKGPEEIYIEEDEQESDYLSEANQSIEAVDTNEAFNNEDIPQFIDLRRKRQRTTMNADYNETTIEIEKEKAHFLEAPMTNLQQESEDMFFFRSLLPHVRKIPAHKKLRFRNRLQEIVEEFAYPQEQSSSFSATHYLSPNYYDSSTNCTPSHITETHVVTDSTEDLKEHL